MIECDMYMLQQVFLVFTIFMLLQPYLKMIAFRVKNVFKNFVARTPVPEAGN